MASTINLSNVNLSIQEFQGISTGKYNAGEVRLTSATTLGKINNRVHKTGENTVSLSHAEVIAIKDAFVKALSANGVDAEAVNRVRRELGLAPDGVTDMSLKNRSIRPLSRQQIREILDRNANAINQHAGPGTIRTDAEIHADYTDREKTALRTKRDATNAALSGSRPLFRNTKISQFQAVVAGDADFRSAGERGELLEMARRQKARILERSNGRPSNAPNATLSYRPDNNGPTVEMPLGMSEAAYVDRLDDIILRLSANRRPGDAVLAARREFGALKDFEARSAWLNAQANAPGGAFKVRTAAVMILHARGVEDPATLSLANRLSDADARALLAILMQLPKDLRGAALRDYPAVAAFAQHAGAEVPNEARTFVPALSDFEFNKAILRLANGGGQDLPHRFKTVLESAKEEIVAHFGAEVFPANFKLGSLSSRWGVLLGFGEDGTREDAPAITPDALRVPLAADAAVTGARRFLQARVATMLAGAGGRPGDAVGVANRYLQRDPALFERLAAAQNPEAAQAIVNESADGIHAAIHLHIVCEEEKSAFVAQCREMFAREMGIPLASLYKGEAMFAKADVKAAGLADKFISGERAAGNDEEVRAAFRQLAEEHVTALANALRKVETLNISQIAKNEVMDQLTHTADVRIIDLDAVAEYARQVNLSSVSASIDAHAPKEEVYAVLKSLLEKTEAMMGLILARRGVQQFGAPELYCVRSLLLSMAGGGDPAFVARIREFAARADVAADDIHDPDTEAGALGTFLAYVAPPEEEKAVAVPFRTRMSAANEIAARFAPEGAATGRALEMGYFRPELDKLRRTAELYQTATGCTVEAAIDAALDHTSVARRLFSYGGRFTASAENFKAGLKLMNDFPAWFAAANAQIDPKRSHNGHLPSGAGVTAINADTSSFKADTKRAFEKFLFEEIAVNGSIPLTADDPERIFGMEANPATRSIGRGYTRSSANTLAQIPPERRSVLYAVIDVLSPLGATEEEARDNALDLITCELISRIMRRYDEVAALKAAGQLTRANVLERLFPDIENGVNLTNRQLKDYYTIKILEDVVPNRLGGDPSLMAPIATMIQTSGATLDEAVNAAIAGQAMPPAPFISSANGPLAELDGTSNGGRKAMLMDLHRPEMPTLVQNEEHALADGNGVFKVVFPDGTVLRSKTGQETDAEVAAANNTIADKVAEFCGSVHPEQLGAVYFALSQSGAGPMNRGLIQHGIISTEHAPLTYTLSKNAETGAITVRYSEPEGLPVRFHWETTIQLDGSSTSTQMVVENP